MNRRPLIALSVATSVSALGLIALRLVSAAPRAAAQPVPSAQDAPSPQTTLFAARGASEVVDAANAFLNTLSDEQRKIAQIELTPQNAARWSNFPAAIAPRNGVYFRDLNAAQTAAALKVARVALSAEGLHRFQEIRAADNAFAKIAASRRGPGGPPGPGPGRDGGPGGPPPGGFGGPGGPPPGGFGGPGGPGGGRNLFGAGNYIIAFLGRPSTTTPWLLQLGGHHIAFNLYYKGTLGASTPYFLGVQPATWKDDNGKPHDPLAPMRDAMHDLIHSLTPEQLTQARLNASFSDVYVGPGRDARFPERSEGVPVSELSGKSRALVKQAIAAWTGDTAQAPDYRKRYDAELDQTKVACSGGTALNTSGDYVRIDGPRVWIEFVVQASDHYHTIWRDRATDYGAEFSF